MNKSHRKKIRTMYEIGVEISDGNHYLTNLTLSKDSVKLPIVGDEFDAIRFDNINQAQAIASYVGGRVEELEE